MGVERTASIGVVHTKSVELVDRGANLTKGLFKGVWAIVVGNNGSEQSLEEASSGVGSVQDLDRGDGDGFGGIQADLYRRQWISSRREEHVSHTSSVCLCWALSYCWWTRAFTSRSRSA